MLVSETTSQSIYYFINLSYHTLFIIIYLLPLLALVIITYLHYYNITLLLLLLQYYIITITTTISNITVLSQQYHPNKTTYQIARTKKTKDNIFFFPRQNM